MKNQDSKGMSASGFGCCSDGLVPAGGQVVTIQIWKGIPLTGHLDV